MKILRLFQAEIRRGPRLLLRKLRENYEAWASRPVLFARFNKPNYTCEVPTRVSRKKCAALTCFWVLSSALESRTLLRVPITARR